jgi:hypothetical protein
MGRVACVRRVRRGCRDRRGNGGVLRHFLADQLISAARPATTCCRSARRRRQRPPVHKRRDPRPAFFLATSASRTRHSSIRATLRTAVPGRPCGAGGGSGSSTTWSAVLRLYAPVTAFRTVTASTSLRSQLRAGDRLLLRSARPTAMRLPRMPTGSTRPAGRTPRGIRDRPASLRRFASRSASRAVEQPLARVPDFEPARRPRLGTASPRAGGRGQDEADPRPVGVHGYAQCSAICPAMFSNDDLGYAVLLAGGVVPQRRRTMRSSHDFARSRRSASASLEAVRADQPRVLRDRGSSHGATRG